MTVLISHRWEYRNIRITADLAELSRKRPAITVEILAGAELPHPISKFICLIHSSDVAFDMRTDAPIGFVNRITGRCVGSDRNPWNRSTAWSSYDGIDPIVASHPPARPDTVSFVPTPKRLAVQPNTP